MEKDLTSPQAQNHPITIIGINSDGTLNLSDHGKTYVNPNDTVTWIIGNKSGVSSITSIVDTIPPDVFAPTGQPQQLGNSTNWRGTISSTIAAGSIETYSIHYLKTNEAGDFSYDPVIQVNS